MSTFSYQTVNNGVASFALARQPCSTIHTICCFCHYVNAAEERISQLVTLITLNCNFSTLYATAVETQSFCVTSVSSLRLGQLFYFLTHQQVELLHTVYTNTLGMQSVYVYKCQRSATPNMRGPCNCTDTALGKCCLSTVWVPIPNSPRGFNK
jgi:hypothetical protein